MTATPIDANFQPQMHPTEIKSRFPDLDPIGTLQAFINHHLEKNDRSHNWEATFLGFCDYRQRQINELRKGAVAGTDSMGYPLDPEKRRAQEMLERPPKYNSGTVYLALVAKYEATGLTNAEAHEAATKHHVIITEAEVLELMEGDTDD